MRMYGSATIVNYAPHDVQLTAARSGLLAEEGLQEEYRALQQQTARETQRLQGEVSGLTQAVTS